MIRIAICFGVPNRREFDELRSAFGQYDQNRLANRYLEQRIHQWPRADLNEKIRHIALPIALQFFSELECDRSCRFSPRDAKVWSYKVESDFPGLNGQSGKFEAVPPPAEQSNKSSVHPNWWIDDPDPAAAVGVHPGAKSVSQWREKYLTDFADRMDRCKPK